MKRITCLLILIFILTSCSKEQQQPKNEEPKITSPKIAFEIIKSVPHDEHLFTQGLIIYKDKFYESTGSPKQTDKSGIYILNINTGEAVKKIELTQTYFGEGITIIKEKLYWLTYMNKTGFVYDPDSFEKTGQFSYDTEGWGLTNDGQHLIMSDGSDKLKFIDPVEFKVKKTIQVHDETGPVKKLNELEYINGHIFANVFETAHILKIDPGTGKVVGLMDFTELSAKVRKEHPGAELMNGIAWNPGSGTIYITGKYWPNIYEIRQL